MSAIANHPHRVTTALAHTRSELSSVTEVPLWTMDAGQVTDALDQLLTVEAQLAELKGRLLVQAQTLDLPGQSGAPNSATWYAARTRTTKISAHRATRVATGLEAHALTREALAAGTVLVEVSEPAAGTAFRVSEETASR